MLESLYALSAPLDSRQLALGGLPGLPEFRQSLVRGYRL